MLTLRRLFIGTCLTIVLASCSESSRNSDAISRGECESLFETAIGELEGGISSDIADAMTPRELQTAAATHLPTLVSWENQAGQCLETHGADEQVARRMVAAQVAIASLSSYFMLIEGRAYSGERKFVMDKEFVQRTIVDVVANLRG